MTDFRLESFVCLCETMNYRAAAERLNITQPAVSQHIRALEQYYGCRLFIYDRRKLTMTAQAEQLLRYARSLMYQEKKLKERLCADGVRTLRIGATKTIGEYVIRRQVEKILEMPEYRLELEIDNTVNILRHIDEGKLDFALVEGYFDRSAYAYRLYRREPFVGLCGATHPFAGRRVDVEELWAERLIVREKDSGTRSILEKMLEGENRSLDDFASVNSISNFGLLCHLVARGLGISFVYRAVVEENTGLSSFLVEGWDISREFNYVFLPDTDAEKDVEFFDSLSF